MSGVAKLGDSPVIPNIYIRDEALNWTKPDDEKQTEQSNTNHAKSLTEQSDETSGMELLTQIAARTLLILIDREPQVVERVLFNV